MIRIETGRHPFHGSKTTKTDYPAVIRVLAEAGANPNLQDKDGNTPLHHTLDVERARAYVAAGANLEVRNAEGETPQLSTFSKDVALALIAAGADTSARAKDGRTIASIAQHRSWRGVKRTVRKSG